MRLPLPGVSDRLRRQRVPAPGVRVARGHCAHPSVQLGDVLAVGFHALALGQAQRVFDQRILFDRHGQVQAQLDRDA